MANASHPMTHLPAAFAGGARGPLPGGQIHGAQPVTAMMIGINHGGAGYDASAHAPAPHLYHTLGTYADPAMEQRPQAQPLAAAGTGPQPRSDVRDHLTKRLAHYKGEMSAPTGKTEIQWLTMPQSQYLCGKGENEVNDWTQAATTYLANIVKEDECPTLMKMLFQMTQRIREPSVAHQAFGKLRAEVMELASNYRVLEHVGAMQVYRTPLASERVLCLVWLVREALLLFFKPDVAEARRKYYDFSPFDSRNKLLWKEPVALLSEFQRAYQDIKTDRPSLPKVLARALGFLDHLAGEYHFVDAPGDTFPGMGTHLRRHFFGLGDTAAPSLTWATLTDKAIQFWNTLTELHSTRQIVFTTGQFAEKQPKADKPARVNAVQTPRENAAGTSTQRPNARRNDKPVCSHCNVGSHPESECWHFHPNHSQCPPEFIPATQAGYDLWQRRRTELRMPRGADFVGKVAKTRTQQTNPNGGRNDRSQYRNNPPATVTFQQATTYQPNPGGRPWQQGQGNGGGRGFDRRGGYGGRADQVQTTKQTNMQNALAAKANEVARHSLVGVRAVTNNTNRQRGQGPEPSDYDRMVSDVSERVAAGFAQAQQAYYGNNQQYGGQNGQDARHHYNANPVMMRPLLLPPPTGSNPKGAEHSMAHTGDDEWDADYGKETGRFFSSAGSPATHARVGSVAAQPKVSVVSFAPDPVTLQAAESDKARGRPTVDPTQPGTKAVTVQPPSRSRQPRAHVPRALTEALQQNRHLNEVLAEVVSLQQQITVIIRRVNVVYEDMPTIKRAVELSDELRVLSDLGPELREKAKSLRETVKELCANQKKAVASERSRAGDTSVIPATEDSLDTDPDDSGGGVAAIKVAPSRQPAADWNHQVEEVAFLDN